MGWGVHREVVPWCQGGMGDVWPELGPSSLGTWKKYRNAFAIGLVNVWRCLHTACVCCSHCKCSFIVKYHQHRDHWGPLGQMYFLSPSAEMEKILFSLIGVWLAHLFFPLQSHLAVSQKATGMSFSKAICIHRIMPEMGLGSGLKVWHGKHTFVCLKLAYMQTEECREWAEVLDQIQSVCLNNMALWTLLLMLYIGAL